MILVLTSSVVVVMAGDRLLPFLPFLPLLAVVLVTTKSPKLRLVLGGGGKEVRCLERGGC